MTIDPEDLDELDVAILEYFLEGRNTDDEPWGKATPTEVYRTLRERGVLEELGDPVRQTIQHRIQRFEVADHLENIHDTGSYRFVSDPRSND